MTGESDLDALLRDMKPQLQPGVFVFCTIQTIFPGAGDKWFGDDYRPSDQWKQSDKWSYLLTVAVPLVLFLAISVWFWWMGKRHRERTIRELDAGVPTDQVLTN